MISRMLDLNNYKYSLFLFGPRQSGKTYLINHTLKPDIFVDLLAYKEFLKYSKDPSILSKEVSQLKDKEALVVIDEIQRCPELLNEVQSIIDKNEKLKFILTGSSARKLKRAGVNLLGGRAVVVHIYPFTATELKELFILEEALCFGTIPKVYLEKDAHEKTRLLRTYVEIYLKEEIQQEAITRNIPAFAKFLELAAYENGNMLNFENMARETAVHSRTIKQYFQILEDTLIGFLLYPYKKSHRKRLASHPKFYFFDCGVVSALKNNFQIDLSPFSPDYGRAFEHWILLEIKKYIDYYELGAKMSFFRTADESEVDLILEIKDEVWAIEIKSSETPSLSKVGALRSFIKDHSCKRAICVCRVSRAFTDSGIEFLPWQEFMAQLINYR